MHYGYSGDMNAMPLLARWRLGSNGWLQYSDSSGPGFALSEKMHGKGARDPLEQHPSFPETLIICRVNRYVL